MNEKFIKRLNDYHLTVDTKLHSISYLHVDVLKYLKNLELNYIVEQKFYGMDVDVIILDEENRIIGVIEINGYQHYVRNEEVMTGDSLLK